MDPDAGISSRTPIVPPPFVDICCVVSPALRRYKPCLSAVISVFCLMFAHQDNSLPDQKKAITDDTSIPADGSSSVILSPEVKDKVNSNRLIAKMKLIDKQTQGLVRDLGLSWFAALESEFTKPYFQQVHFWVIVHSVYYYYSAYSAYYVCLTFNFIVKNFV